MAVNIGPRIGIDGEAEYRKQLNNIIQQQKTLAAEMRATESAFDKNATAQERASAKAASLTKQIDLQRQRVEMASKMVEESSKAYGDADDKTLKWKQVLADATTDLNKLESELRDTVDVVLDTGDGFETSAENIDEASRALDDSVGSAGRASEGWSAFGAVVANIATDILRKAVDGVKNFASGMVEAAAEVAASNAQFSQTFGELEGQADSMVKSIADSTGILDTRLRDSASGVYAFARSSGASTEEAMALTDTALRAAADSAAYYDISLEEATDRLQSFLKGNMNMDSSLGVSATETTRNAEAMELFGKKYNDLTEIQKQQTLLKMVTDAQELSGAMGQASREADGWANVTGNLAEALKQAQARFGAPILERLTPKVQELTEGFLDFAENAYPKFLEGMEWIETNAPTIGIALGGIAAAFVAFKWGEIVSGVTGAASAFKAFGVALAANPVGLVILGITALVVAIKYLWDNCEWFRDGVKSVLSAIVGAGESAYNWVVNAFRDIGNFFTVTIPGWFNSAKTSVSSFVTNIKNKFDEIKKSISDKIGAARDAVKGAIDKIKGFFSFNITWPKIPLPHFSVSPPGWKIGDLLKGSIPSLSISWYRKAYDNPIVFTKPTVIPTARGLLGFGDGPGAEVVIGMNRLEELVAAGAAARGAGSFSPVINIYPQPGQDPDQIADTVMRRMQYAIAKGF